MTEKQTKEELKNALDELKKDTGIDLTPYIDNVVVLDAEDGVQKINIGDMKGASLDSDKAKELMDQINKAMKENADVSVMCKSILKRDHAVDDWECAIIMPDATVMSSYNTQDENLSAAMTYSVRDSLLSYQYTSAKISYASITYEVTDKTREGFMSAVALLAKHIELLSPVYDYVVPSVDACEAFVNDVHETVESIKSVTSKIKEAESAEE